MTQKFASLAELHADHRHWANDISMWKDDIELWKKQHSAALDDLEEIIRLIRQNDHALDCHLDALETIESGLQFHEKNLAGSIVTGSGADLDEALVERHAETSAKFASQRRAHESMKKHHHIAMAYVATLKTALESVGLTF